MSEAKPDSAPLLELPFEKTEGQEALSAEQISYMNFMKKPEVIKMHLDILYKSIMFVKKEKIDSMLEDYLKQKTLKQK